MSFLFPLPEAGEQTKLVSVVDAGGKGTLLPARVVSALPSGFVAFSTTEVSAARVVSARVDPCFVATATPSPCRKQIRLVAQPIDDKGATVDAAVHLFYDLDDAAFAKVVLGLRSLKQRAGAETDGKPLGVHPVIAREGLGGAYETELRALILAHIGESNLSRVAIMQLQFPGSAWKFASFDVTPSTVTPVAIEGLGGVTSQQVNLSDTAIDKLTFPAKVTSKLSLLLDRATLENAPAVDLEDAVKEAYAIENPGTHGPGTIDCASCHVATRARRLASQVRSITLPAAPERYGFAAEIGDDAQGLATQRAFGYIGTTPSLSQRVANESAEVACAISATP